MPTTTFTINLRLSQILRTVVIGSHLRTIRDVQRLGVFILAGGVRVGEGFLGEGGDASGLVVVVALLHLFLDGVDHIFAFVAARPVDGVDGRAFVFIATVAGYGRHGGAGRTGFDVAAFGHDAGGDDAERGEQKQESNVHRAFLFKSAGSDQCVGAYGFEIAEEKEVQSGF